MNESMIPGIITILGVILFSMTLHEAMHGFVAYWLGDDTAKLQGRLTLNPIKHIDPFLTILLPIMLAIVGAPIFGGAKPVPFNPSRVRYDEWGAAFVALAGPLTNLLIAFVVFGIAAVMGYDISAFSPSNIVQMVLTYGVIVNLGFFIFNMIPLPPLDGSRVLYALAPEFIRRGMEYIEQYGIIFVFAIVLLGSSYIGIFMSQTIQFFLDLFGKIFLL
jgi:Zn-dependent protease